MKTKMFAILFILAYVLSGCGTATLPPLPTETPEPPTPTETPSPIPDPTDTPTPDSTSQVLAFPSASCCNGKTMEAGVYETPAWFGIPLAMALEEGWRAVNDDDALLFMLGKGRNIYNDPIQALIFIAVPGGNPQAVITSVSREPGLTQEGEITETTLAGFHGLQVDLTAKPNPGYEGDKESEILPGSQFLPHVNTYFAPGFIWTTWTAESKLRFIVLSVEENVLLIEIDSPPAEFEAFADDAILVIQTLGLIR
jgi:hypothetical protein